MLEGDARRIGSDLSNKVESEMESKLSEEIISSEVRRLSSQSYIYADIAEAYPRQSPEWSKHLNIAIELNEDALMELGKLPEDHPKKKRRECVIKSNLAYCLAVLGDSALKEKAFEHARFARENSPRFPDSSYRWEDTYGWVMLTFGDEGERRDAVIYLEALYNRGSIPQGWAAKRKENLAEFLRSN